MDVGVTRYGGRTLVNLPAMLIVLGIMVLLVIGVRESARFNAAMVAMKLAAVAFFIVVGFTYVEPENWSPFMPYGFSGVMTGSGGRLFCLYRFRRGLDHRGRGEEPEPRPADRHHFVAGHLHAAVSDRGRHSHRHHPGRAVQVGHAVPQRAGGIRAGGDHKDWAAGLVSAGAVAGITSVLLVMLMSQPRIFFAMSRDRLLPAGVSKVHPQFRTPYITTIITCVIVAAVAGFVPINILGEMTSIGTLFAFVVVSLAVIILRIKRPEARRPFRVPLAVTSFRFWACSRACT